MDRHRAGQQKPVRRGTGNADRRADVRGYLRHDPHRGGAVCQGRAARFRAVIHDGGDHAVAALAHHAAQGGEAEAPGTVHRHLRGGHNRCWLSL